MEVGYCKQWILQDVTTVNNVDGYIVLSIEDYYLVPQGVFDQLRSVM